MIDNLFTFYNSLAQTGQGWSAIDNWWDKYHAWVVVFIVMILIIAEPWKRR